MFNWVAGNNHIQLHIRAGTSRHFQNPELYEVLRIELLQVMKLKIHLHISLLYSILRFYK